MSTDHLELTLPTLKGLFPPPPTSSILRPFSLFSISTRLFHRSTPPSLPAISLLDPILDLIPIAPIRSQDLIKALVGVQTFATQLKSYLSNTSIVAAGKCTSSNGIDSGGKTLNEGYSFTPQIEDSLGRMMAAFLYSTGACAIYLGSLNLEEMSKKETEDVRVAFRQCLEGTFLLRITLQRIGSPPEQVESAVQSVNDALLASIFKPTMADHPFAPLLEHPRSLTSALQQAIRSSAVKSRVSPAPPTPELEAEHALNSLNVYISYLTGVESLTGPVKANTKRQKEEEKCRPLRVLIEARLVACDLALSMATATISAVKRRASKRIRKECSGSVDRRETEEDQAADDDENSDDDDDSAAWDELAETILDECLAAALDLVDHKRSHILVDEVRRDTWFGRGQLKFTPTPSPPATSRARSLSASSADSSLNTNDEEIDSGVEGSDTETETETEDGGLTHPCPLRSLFRLHDRFEEQRLAVWMSLSAEKRPKMGLFVRGTNGKIGKTWDDLGLALMLDFTSDALLSHGLGADSLDKWLELAQRRNSKRIRHRGRKTI